MKLVKEENEYNWIITDPRVSMQHIACIMILCMQKKSEQWLCLYIIIEQ